MRHRKILKNVYDPGKAIIRMSWDPKNLYNLASRMRLPDMNKKNVFQQKWIASRELRGYHVPNITQRQLLQRHWSDTLPMQQMTQKEKNQLPPVQALCFGELERRVDVMLFRSHFASSIFKARKAVMAGHVSVNGKQCKFPARRLEDGDMISMLPFFMPQVRANGPSKPVDFKARDWMAPFMYTPEYIEVDYSTCSAVFLRSPLPQPNRVEIPSPFPPSWHQLVYERFSRISKNKTSLRTNPSLLPQIVAAGQAVKLKPKFASIWRADQAKLATKRRLLFMQRNETQSQRQQKQKQAK